jgi:hypothetical protein
VADATRVRAPAALATWSALNERQRRYLAAIYRRDQAAEQAARGGGRDWGPRLPASEWRWVDFAIKAPVDVVGRTVIQEELRAAGEHDQGAGSSLAALKRRRLIDVDEDRVQVGVPPLGLVWVPRVRVRLTMAGRAAARAGLQDTRPSRTPKGLLSQWLWRQLVQVGKTEPAGLIDWELGGDAHVYLGVDYRVGRNPSRGYIREREHRRERLPDGRLPSSEWRYHLTAAGRAHILEHLETYRRLYPDIDVGGLAELVRAAARAEATADA